MLLSAPARRSIARLSGAVSFGSTTTPVTGTVTVTNATLRKAAATTTTTTQQTQLQQQQLVPARRAFSTSVRPKNTTTTATATATRAARAAYYSQETQGKKAGENKIWAFEEIQTLIEDPKRSVIIVDTREPSELATTGRIPGAINIPITTSPDSFFISEDEFEDRFGFPRPSKDSEVVFYCKAGVRSRGAAGLAREAGWEKVGEYPGSWLDWAAKGGKVER